jgi:hypothetical protein
MGSTGFIRVGPDAIVVDLPLELREFVDKLASDIEGIVSDPTTSAHDRICGPINVSVDYDDPLTTLEREMGIGQLCSTVHESKALSVLNDEQAESWLKVISLSLSAVAARLSIVDEQTLEAVQSRDPQATQVLALLQTLQSILCAALDDGEEPDEPN